LVKMLANMLLLRSAQLLALVIIPVLVLLHSSARPVVLA